MVVNEGACLLGPPAQEPWGPSIPVPQSVILHILDSLLEDALCGEVKGSNTAARGADPVAQDLARSVLVIVHCITIPSVQRG